MFKLMHKRLKNQTGFTLVELMVVVVIIGILVGIAVPTYNKVTGNAEKNACFANQRTIEGAAQVFKLETGGYPDDFDALIDANATGGPYFQAEPECPAAGTYTLDGEGVVECDADGHDRTAAGSGS